MIRRVATSAPKALSAAALGAIAGAVWVVLFYTMSPGVVVEFDREMPAGVARGFHQPEHTLEGVTFAWTGLAAELSLPGLDRNAAWEIRVRYQGGRPDPSTLPDVMLDVDGAQVAAARASNTVAELLAAIPRRPGERGLALRVRTSKTFRPGGTDPRELGVMIDRIVLEPVDVPFTLAPRASMGATALAGAVFGLGLGFLGVTAGSAIGGVVLFTAGIAGVLCRGITPYLVTPASVAALVGAVTFMMVLGAGVVEKAQGAALRNTARFALAFSAGALVSRVLVLSHPHPSTIDVQPAAILAVNAFAGVLLYAMVARSSGDRLAAAMTVALYQLVPANLRDQANGTFTLGVSLMTAALAGISLGWPAPPSWWRVATLALLLGTAMALHAIVLSLLSATLLVLVLGLAVSRSAVLRGSAIPIAAAGIAGVALALVAPSTLGRTLGGSVSPALAHPSDIGRVFGWPTLALALAGLAWFWRRGQRDRLTTTLWAWTVGAAVFLVSDGVGLTATGAFVAWFPALAAVAALGAGWGWRSGGVGRPVVAGLLAWTVGLGLTEWLRLLG